MELTGQDVTECRGGGQNLTDESQMTSSVMRGAFLRNASLRREFLGLI